MERLYGPHYVRLAPGAAEAVAPYVDMPPQEIDELVVDLETWPEAIRPAPLRARDGRLLPGDPILLDAGAAGLLLTGDPAAPRHDTAWVGWNRVRELYVVGCLRVGA